VGRSGDRIGHANSSVFRWWKRDERHRRPFPPGARSGTREINGLDVDALNWVPLQGANSISTIVTHLVGSEAETLRTVAGLRSDRDRGAEFVAEERTAGEVRALLDRADDLIVTVTAQLDPDRLSSVFSLPTLPRDEVRSGLTWLVGNYGHAREHVGQIQLTRQLYEGQHSSAS
jgi:Protein of unknown function (DUF1572)